MSEKPTTRTGSCHCGAVRYEISGPMRQVVGCHCTQCRKSTGHYVAATNVGHEHFRIVADAGLHWFRSSDFAQRGFCRECGSNLLWQRDGAPKISVMAGTIDGDTGLTIEAHIFCDDAGDYYKLDDTIPQFPQSD